MIANYEEEEGSGSRPVSMLAAAVISQVVGLGDELFIFEEQLQVDFKNRLEEAHICALIQADLVFPDVDNEDLTSRESEESAFALKVLVFTTLTTIGAFHIHDEDVVGHLGAVASFALVLGHPDTLCRLTSFVLGHDGEFGAKEVVEKCRLAGRLRTENRDEVVVETSWRNTSGLEIIVEVVTVIEAAMVSRGRRNESQLIAKLFANMDGIDLLEFLFFVNHLYAMFVVAVARLLAHGSKVAIHGDDGIGCEAERRKSIRAASQ